MNKLTKEDLNQMNDLNNKIEKLENETRKLESIIWRVKDAKKNKNESSYYEETKYAVFGYKKKIIKIGLFAGFFTRKRHYADYFDKSKTARIDEEIYNEITLNIEDLETLIEFRRKKIELLKEQFENYTIL